MFLCFQKRPLSIHEYNKTWETLLLPWRMLVCFKSYKTTEPTMGKTPLVEQVKQRNLTAKITFS